MSTAEQGPATTGRRMTPDDVRAAQFPRATMLRPGYGEEQVDRFRIRTADELARLHAEKADLRDQVRALREQLDGAAAQAPVPPSDQAVRILATAQQTADSYVAEAEDFSRQMTTDARAQYEEQLRRARESAGEIIQAAQEAATRMVGEPGRAASGDGERSTQELEEQAAYLRAFAQACRTQLRGYLEALLADVEAEWGRADPGSLPRPRPAAPRPAAPPDQGAVAPNVARETPMDDNAENSGGQEVLGPRR